MELTFRPSSAHRWLTCAGSAALEADLPDSPGVWATEGARQHTLAEAVLTGVLELDELPIKDAELITPYVNAIRDRARLGVLHVEQKVSCEYFEGTPDAYVILSDEIQIHDRKLPFGRFVPATENAQLSCYALCLRATLKAQGVPHKEFKFFVHQGLQSREWSVPDGYLDHFEKRVITAQTEARNANATLTPGEFACRYCKAKAVCPALQKLARNVLTAERVNVDNERQNQNQNLVALVRLWADAVEKATYNALQTGQELLDWKLVAGRNSPRTWKDPIIAEKALCSMRIKKHDMYTQTLISPTQAEKLLRPNPTRWARLEAYITRKEAKAMLVSKQSSGTALYEDFFDSLPEPSWEVDLPALHWD